MSVLAIIPARSGSKGLKNKNIKLLCGKPLMAYTIEAAVESGCFDEIMVSTDSGEYASIAKEAGAQIPFFRSRKTASDEASTWDVVFEVLDKYKKQGKEFTHVCILQPTSPLRNGEDIKRAFADLHKKNAKAIVSVCEAEHSPVLCGTLGNEGSMCGFIDRNSNRRRQDIGSYYRINGAIYISDIDFLMEDSFLYRKGCFGCVLQPSHSIDIDTELDFIIAESILKYRDI